jgi:DNA-binding transcriptional ArsR family regulator
LFGDKLGDPTADQILEALRNVSMQGLTRADINHLFQRHKSEAELQRAIGVLLGLGLIRGEKEDTGGRPVTRYFTL